MLENSAQQKTGFPLSGFTMTKNWYFDEVLPNETLAVVRVVGYFIRNSIGRTGYDGARVQEVEASVEWLARQTRLDKKSVLKGLRIALEKGYLFLTKVGHSGKTGAGVGSFYRVNWDWSNNYVNQQGQAQAEKFPPDSGENFHQATGENFHPINNKTQDLNKPVEIKAATRRVSTYQRQNSDLISKLVSDLSRDFGDNPAFVRPNISRALNLWEKSGLAEADFVALLYRARQKTQAGANIRRKRQSADGSSSNLPNRMPYFFTVLAELTAPIDPVIGPKPDSAPIRLDAVKQFRGNAEFKVEAKPNLQPVTGPVLSPPDRLETAQSLEPADNWQEADDLTEAPPPLADEAYFEELPPVTTAPESLFGPILARLDWLSSTKQAALAQAELLPDSAGTRARFSLKFAKNWQKSLFAQWELDRLGLLLAEAHGEAPYILSAA